MLDNLSGRLTFAVKKIRGQARLTEANMGESLRDIRMALLEADVALPVVKDFIASVRQKALGEAVIGSLTPGQALVGVVHRELIALMGGEQAPISFATQPPAVVLLAGLQGAGKTTSVGKLARWLKTEQKKKALTVSCDVYRPAAIEQLQSVSAQADVDFFPVDEIGGEATERALAIAQAAHEWARRHYYDVLLVDTAGRLGIDEVMMKEIQVLHQAVSPIETLFVVDAMQGQDAVNTARAFGEALPLTGVVLSKLDGDARGGAALSVRQVTGAPIKFVGIGEKLDGLEAFYPERMASRILGMGDILSLIEETHKNVDAKEAEVLAKKIKSGKGFDLSDFKAQLVQMRNMGGVGALLDKLPSQFAQIAGQAGQGDGEAKVMLRTEGIIDAMTPNERRRPDIIKASRKRRIATGAGVTVQEVNRLLKQFEKSQHMMKRLGKGGSMTKLMRGMPGLGGGIPGIPGR